MTTLVRLDTAEDSALIEVWRPSSDVVPIASLDESVIELKASVKSKLKPILDLAKDVRNELATLSIDSAEIEFGFGLMTTGSVYVVAVEAEATFKVKLVFKGKPDGKG
jgi:hypothetical protein